jgi:hypothetical protein
VQFNSFALITAELVLTALFAVAQATETLIGAVSDRLEEGPDPT